MGHQCRLQANKNHQVVIRGLNFRTTSKIRSALEYIFEYLTRTNFVDYTMPLLGKGHGRRDKAK